jgi:chemotaxis protein MotB
MKDDEIAHGEILIIRRGNGDHDDEHHGGVWKIAFADFMTALMAFFLVMWLINASNEETRKGVASYFNPIKLLDTTSNPKGVKNPKYGVEQTTQDEEEISTEVTNTPKARISGEKNGSESDEQAIFSDPFSLLSEIEGGIVSDATEVAKLEKDESGRNAGIGLNGGVLFQDPFDPSVWNIREGAIKANENTGVEEQPSGSSEGEKSGNGPSEEANEGEASQSAGVTLKAGEREEFNTESEEEAAKPDVSKQEKSAADLQDAGEKSETANAELAEVVEKEIEALKQQPDFKDLDVEVVSGKEGTTVLLSDTNINGMFNIGSARPTKQLVLAMKRLGEIVSSHKGMVEISGHTDGRKYQSEDYDNWRLSTARAHMAYYMLMRGGMKEAQVEKISGQADVKLRVPDDPFSAMNRRIEVLLKASS